MKLGDITRESRETFKGDKTGIPIVGLEHLIPQELTFSAYDVDTDNTFTKMFHKGQILFGRRRAYLKKAAVAEFDGICSGDITVIEAIPGKVDKDLLPFIIQNDALFDYAVSRSAGGLSPRVKWEQLSDYEINLPPIEDQKVLADKLWAAYRLKEGYKKLLCATDEMVKSQFIEMFGNPLSLNQKNELKRLGECCILNPRRPNIALCDTDKVSFIPMPAVSEDGYLVDMTDEEYGKVKKGFTYFENNDVLFAKITPCMENGKGAIVHGLTNGIGMGSTEFHVLRPINGISSPYWLLALTRMPIFRERAAKNMSGTGGQKRVSASYLDHFMVGLPAIEEQRRFEAIYKQADKSKFGDFKSQFIEMFKNIPSVKIADCCITVSGGTPNTKKIEYYDGGDIPWLSSGEINQGYIFSTDKYITQLGLENSSAKWVPANSVVIAMYGATAGKVGFIKIPLTTNQAVCTLLPNDGFEPLYLYYATLSKTSWMISQCRGAAQPNISQSIIRSMEIPMATIDEQKRFCKLLTQADKSKFELKQCIENIDKVIKSLING